MVKANSRINSSSDIEYQVRFQRRLNVASQMEETIQSTMLTISSASPKGNSSRSVSTLMFNKVSLSCCRYHKRTGHVLFMSQQKKIRA